MDLNGGRKSKIRGHRRKKERKPVELDGGRKEREKNKQKKHPVDSDRSEGRDRTMDQRTGIFLLGVTKEQMTGRHKGIGL